MKFLAISLNHPAHYFTLGPFAVSAGNLAIIFFMILIFSLALVLPFPEHSDLESGEAAQSSKGGNS